MTYVASRAYRAARREAEELEDVEVGSRVTCHVSRVTMMLVSVSSCYNLAPGHHPRLPPPQCPLHHRKGDDRCGNVIVCCNMLLYQHNECNRPLPRRAGQVAVAGERGGPGHPRHLPGGRDHGALHRVSQ